MTSIEAPLYTQHSDMVHDAQYDFYGRYLATCSSDSTVKIFETGAQPYEVDTLHVHQGPVWCVAWGHPRYGSPLASCGYDQKVVVSQRNHQTGKYEKIHEYAGHTSSVNAVAWAPSHFNQAMLASCSSDSTVTVLTYHPDQPAWEVSTIANAHQIGVNCVAWEQVPSQQNYQRVASGGADNLLKVWVRKPDSKNFELEQDVLPEGTRAYSEWVRDVAFCPTPFHGSSLLASCSGSEVFLWLRKDAGEKSRWQLLAKLKLAAEVRKLSWSEEESLLAASCSDHKAYVYKNVNLANPGEWKEVSTQELSQ
eukprot:TRINITY_DN51627_c0_g1_i1.p1 TRINITY_DN51627_c0_g1~~TRINITY_DN51627_c0_g1_i1.p1  ORF type:complete len:308 (+),score=76.79 TRINITY_DN51627_c0_g1_i1:171-1094(+)